MDRRPIEIVILGSEATPESDSGQARMTEWIMDLTEKECIPCESGDPPLPDAKEDELLSQVAGWQLIRDGMHMIRRQFKFKDFVTAMQFVNKVADLAESEGHHPDIKIVYNRVNLDLFTHAVGGLSENDFILAAKINQLFSA